MAAPPPHPPPPERYVFIDALRLVAALQMIVGHTLDALLDDGLRSGPGFRAWTFARGLTSTAFFCAAGLSFALSSAGPRARTGRRHRLVRAGELLVVGYALRAPLAVLWGEPAAAALARFLLPDVLHAMAAALLACELIVGSVANRLLRAGLAIGVGLLCFGAAAPLASALADSCTATRAWVVPGCGAPFPLFPWLGYPLCALGVGLLCLTPAGGEARPRLWLRLLGMALACLVCAALARALGRGASVALELGFALLKLGLVLGLCACLSALLAVRTLPRLLGRLARETLFLYASHVLVLYAGSVGLAVTVGHRLPLGAALAVALVLCVGAGLGALTYPRLFRALRGPGPGGTPRPQRSSPPG